MTERSPSRAPRPRARARRTPARPSPSREVTTADRVANRLVDYIRRNRLRSGDPLPSELRLARELAVSRGVVREALRSLASTGVLHIANGRAPRVGSLDGRIVARFLEHGLSTEQLEQPQVLDVRAALEIETVALAARHRTDADVEALRAAVDDMRRAGRTRAPFVDADIRFHDIIGRASGNPLFAVLGAAIRQSLDGAIRAGLHSRRTPDELRALVDLHSDIAEAVAARRPAAAQRLMRVHFIRTWHYVFGTPPPAFGAPSGATPRGGTTSGRRTSRVTAPRS